MKLTTAKTLRHGPSPYEQYTEKNPELTRIKAAENFTRINGMMDFYKRTSRIVIAAAGLLLVVSLAVSYTHLISSFPPIETHTSSGGE